MLNQAARAASLFLCFFIAGCFTSDEPRYKVDDPIVSALLPDNSMVYFSGYGAVESYSGKVWKKEGMRATYESDEFDDIMFLQHKEGGILSQFRRKSDGRVFYLCFASQGETSSDAFPVESGFHTRFNYREFTDKRFSKQKIVKIDGAYDLRMLGRISDNPCARGNRPQALMYGKVLYSGGYVLDMDTAEGRALNEQFAANIKACGQIFCDLVTDEDKWVSQLRPQLRRAVLGNGCVIQGALFRASQYGAKGDPPFEMTYDAETGCDFSFLGIVQFRLDIGGIDVSQCKGGECDILYAIDCTAGSGIGMEACSKDRHLRGNLKAKAAIRDGEAVFLSLEKRDGG